MGFLRSSRVDCLTGLPDLLLDARDGDRCEDALVDDWLGVCVFRRGGKLYRGIVLPRTEALGVLSVSNGLSPGR